jgi:dTDP-4-dehydrorhamnose reductase
VVSRHTSILVTGGDGRLATALRAYFPLADYASHKSLDVSQWQSCRAWFGKRQYDVVIHCAAATKHDTPAQVLLNSNVIGTANMVQMAQRQGARFVYCSTDYVYPGRGNHKETDPVWPANTYAWSKLAGESAAQTYHKTLIVRGSWYDQLQLTRASTDAYSSKVPVSKAAEQIASLAVSSATGIVNIGGPRRSLYEVVATEFNPRVEPILRRQVDLPYALPADVSLDLTRMKAILQ